MHGVAALLFFLAIGYVCIFRSGDTLKLIEDLKARASYVRSYRVIGFVMWVFPLVVTVLQFFKVRPFGSYTVFFIEVAGIWTFAAYWLLKSREISLTGVDAAAIKGALVRPTRKPGMVQYLLDTTPL